VTGENNQASGIESGNNVILARSVSLGADCDTIFAVGVRIGAHGDRVFCIDITVAMVAQEAVAIAAGIEFEGVVGYDVLTGGDRIALTGGFGVGFVDGNNGHSFGSNDDTVWGGRVGAQWTWGRKAVPYAMK
jgi:hypothetical protein